MERVTLAIVRAANDTVRERERSKSVGEKLNEREVGPRRETELCLLKEKKVIHCL